MKAAACAAIVLPVCVAVLPVFAAAAGAPPSTGGTYASAVSQPRTTRARPPAAGALSGPGPGSGCCRDPRLRDVLYSADEVYRLPAYVGYQIDLQFQTGERLVGLGAGDLRGLSYSAVANHLFIKPKAGNVHTNLTVLTDRRIYHFDYITIAHAPDRTHADVIYALRFLYPAAVLATATAAAAAAKHSTASSASAAPLRAPRVDSTIARPRNSDYRYSGRHELAPLQIWDDGVQTHLVFGPRVQLPAVFVRNDDGSEALVDLHVEGDQIVVHRIARHFILRRGRLRGDIVNRAFDGGGRSLPSGTLLPGMERRLRHATAPAH